ncbi:hypothetical protein DPMN_111542 [Dreissena polymorpha]|uniref:Uncharacterized protein n=1 Tax=Dreissena polymorpha TaxID=45954 RepID=A0A9D4KFC4_DREPO|nr:hypothetical protein DPMN_111542 [Dreissena polymorpha]
MQVNSSRRPILVKVGSHCRSDQLDHPDHRKSPTKPDQARLKREYTTSSRPLVDNTRPHTTHLRRPLNHLSDFRSIISTYTQALHDLSSTK